LLVSLSISTIWIVLTDKQDSTTNNINNNPVEIINTYNKPIETQPLKAKKHTKRLRKRKTNTIAE